MKDKNPGSLSNPVDNE
ncbi:Protein of unknown function [Lactobacillus helveticus CIRM-BIA 951]|uniref:Uncharacterized protein n=1 Tax=Lactobacillus helveticus CIRM-BIA 951 TaxID=1226334 RepID=U6F1S0_LACHE|nr:Protein of unknown function [Lactobacillus helveticus CIRM-BIA 951]